MDVWHLLTNFLVPCFMMGLGIAIDVTIATVSGFRDKDQTFKTWTLPITITHVMFPAAGYYLFWGLAEVFPVIQPLLGIVGFALVGLFVYEVVCKSVGSTPVFGISDWVSEMFGLQQDDSRRFIAILAVSWDALWSGPAKAAQAAAGHWTTNEVFISFLVAGAIVALIAQLALYVAYRLRSVRFSNPKTLARFNFFGKLVELSVIGGFGMLSLWQGVTGVGNIYASILMALAMMSYVFLLYRRELMKNEFEDAKAAVT